MLRTYVQRLHAVPEEQWAAPRAEGKWSVAQEALHVAMAYENFGPLRPLVAFRLLTAHTRHHAQVGMARLRTVVTDAGALVADPRTPDTRAIE